jgi:ATP-binding cassette subfamily B protein
MPVPSRVRQFLAYYRPYRRLLAIDLLCALAASAALLLIPLCARAITGEVVVPGRDLADSAAVTGEIARLGVLMLMLTAVYTVCNTIVNYQGHMMGTYIERDMRAELFAHYLKLPFRFHDSEKTGRLLSRLTHDLNAITELAHHGPEEGAIALIKFVGAFAILFTISIPLTLLILLFMPVMGAWAVFFHHRLRAAARAYNEKMADLNAQAEDALAGIRVVQAFTNEPLERARFAAENARFVEARRRIFRGEAWFYDGMVAFTQMLSAAVIVFGALAIVGGSLTLPDLVAYLLFVGILIDPINKFINLIRLYQEGIVGFTRFREVVEIAPEIADAADAVAHETVQGAITFQDVGFRYDDEYGHVLRGISFTAAPGDYTAVVGASGVGKTTLLQLIPRFYDVSEGAILLDGHDIRRIKLASLRAHIGVVAQDVYLFGGTVRENIAYGRPGADDAAIIAAAQAADAHAFIVALPHGYDTVIGQRGIRLSGGQKQRLSIARMFLKNPAVLILDEATSALDSESERTVQASLERLAHGRTTFVIAHRLSTVQNAGRILVLGEHGIEEAGTHAGLLAQGGVYARLVRAQQVTPETG